MANNTVKSVVFQVAGVFTHGKHEGKTNPKQTVDIRMVSRMLPNGEPLETVKDLTNRLKRETGNAFFRIIEVEAYEPEGV